MHGEKIAWLSIVALVLAVVCPCPPASASPDNWTQTTQAEFQTGTLSQVETTTSLGDVKLNTFSNSVTDTFADETKIASKSNLVVTGGQVKLTTGASKQATLRPNANGSKIEFVTLVGAPTHYQAVYDVTPDDGTSYVGSEVANSTDLFALTDTGLAAGTTINSITVYGRATKCGGSKDWRIVIKSGTTEAYSSTFTESSTWVNRSYQWTTDPNTGGAWTVAAVDALQAGAYVVTGVQVTQVYVVVGYSGYNSPGTLTSKNLLLGQSVVSIDSFGYNVSSIPAGTSLKVQFSKDSTNWYNSAGTLGGWDTLSQGTHSIGLSGLGWSGPNFYYKMEFTTDTTYTYTPVLDEISVNFSKYYSSGTLTSSTHDNGYAADFTTISFTVTEPSGTDIKFQLRTAATEGGLSSATWYGPTGTTDYYQTSGAAINSVHDGHRWIQYKAYFSTSDTSKTPTLSDITINYNPLEFISFTVTDYNNDGVLFSTLNPGQLNQPADQTAGVGAVTLTVGSETSVNVNVQLKGTDFTYGGNTIPISNVKYNNTNTPVGASTLTGSYVTWYTVTAGSGDIHQCYHWISIPNGQVAGPYTSTFFYQAIKQ